MKRQLVALAVLQGLDLLTTFMGLGAGALERNPVGAGLLGHGFGALVAVKVLGTVAVAGIAWLLWRGSPVNRGQAVAGLQAGCGFMVAVVGWNSWVMFLHGAV